LFSPAKGKSNLKATKTKSVFKKKVAVKEQPEMYEEFSKDLAEVKTNA
jgi:hypothetical protein